MRDKEVKKEVVMPIPTFTRYAYRTSNEAPIEMLNDYGNQGWEYIGFHAGVHVFRRTL